MKKTFAGRATLFLLALVVFAPAFGQAKEEKKENPLVKEAQATMDRVCKSMVPYLIRPWRYSSVKIEDSPEVNAYVDPKGDVVFFMGIINLFQSEDEAALVCGHEMAHASGKHFKRSIGTQILGGIAGAAIGGTLGDIAGGMLVNKQSRSHEREADSNGLTSMWSAGYDPRTSWRLWEAMNELGQGEPLLAKYLSSHPVEDERINNLKVSTYKLCKEKRKITYCDEVLADPELRKAFESFK